MSDELCGYAGKILVVDLTKGEISTLPSSDYVKKFIGGRALGARLYWDFVSPECGALDPENAIIFATGPGAGTLSPGGARVSVSTKSPASIPEAYSTSTTGGSAGSELKFAGYDALVVTGKAEKPVYLRINDSKVTIESAAGLWGMTVRQLDRELKQLYGIDNRIFCIGPSGETMGKYASIINDFSHATGQGGFGAVMGSKNLKAIVIHGTGCIKVADPKGLMDQFMTEVYKEGPNESSSIAVGTLTVKPHSLFPVAEERRDALKAAAAAADNLDDFFDVVDHYDGAIQMVSDFKNGDAIFKFGGCYSCPGPCHFAAKYKDASIPSISMNLCHQPSACRAADEAVYGKNWSRADYLFNTLCIDYGMSVDIMGLEHEWVFDMIKAGYITKEDFDLGDDFDPKDPKCWLNEDYIREMVRRVAYREGKLYQLFSDGPDLALDYFSKIDQGAKDIADKFIIKKYYHSTDSSSFPKNGAPIDQLCMQLDYKYMHHNPYQHWRNGSSNTTKAMSTDQKNDGLKNARKYWAKELFDLDVDEPNDVMLNKDYTGKGQYVSFFQDMNMEMDSMCYCGWAGWPMWQSRNNQETGWVGNAGTGAWMYNTICGGNRTFKENVAAFTPASMLMRAIHVREGRRKEHDLTISPQVWIQKDKWGNAEMWKKGIEDCYEARGWDPETGIPLKQTLIDNGLDFVVTDFKNRGIELK